MTDKMRLHKAIALTGIASRRKAEILISEGRVRLNNKIVTRQGIVVDPSKDKIEVFGKKLDFKITEKIYFLLNKPKDCVTSVKDPHNKKTVMHLLPKIKGLFPVGRLDKDTTGLLLITNDGDLAYRLTHPKFNVFKVYNVTVKPETTNNAQGRGGLNLPYLVDKVKLLEKGIVIDNKKTAPCKTKIAGAVPASARTGLWPQKQATIQITIHEGRKRQVKRMFEAIGYKVLELDRVEYAGLKNDIKLGTYRELSKKEIEKLHSITRHCKE